MGGSAGVDFPYLLYRDQVGELVEQCQATPGVRWERLLTDLPTALGELRRAGLDWRAYVRSLRAADVEAVFSREDPVPGFVEITMLPYLAVRRGF